jgi:hypothetical protein
MNRDNLPASAPLLDTLDLKRWWSPWSEGAVAICGDAAHPMMPNLGQGGCQSTEVRYTHTLTGSHNHHNHHTHHTHHNDHDNSGRVPAGGGAGDGDPHR